MYAWNQSSMNVKTLTAIVKYLSTFVSDMKILSLGNSHNIMADLRYSVIH